MKTLAHRTRQKPWITSSGWLSATPVLGLGLVFAPEFWPAAESPPQQGEALDSGKLADGHAVHAASALARLIREPQNTWSNLAFVICGAWLAIASTRKISRMVGMALMLVGIGSLLYHASASTFFRILDVGSMYGLFFTLFFLAAGSFNARIEKLTRDHPALLLSSAALFAVVLTLSRSFDLFGFKPLSIASATVITSLLLIGSGLYVILKQRAGWLRGFAALTLFALAAACQIGDRPGGWLCDPNHVIQAHAVWHVLSALALLLYVQLVDRFDTSNKAHSRDYTLQRA
jgi:hypothetical protein